LGFDLHKKAAFVCFSGYNMRQTTATAIRRFFVSLNDSPAKSIRVLNNHRDIGGP